MKTGLVLEGGALRTIYSSGVTDGLLEGNIDFDYVVGVSAGIAYGVSFLSRQFGRNLEILMRYATDKRYMGARNLLIKCGAPGLYFTDGTIERFEQSYKPDRVLSGTGAGDTSIAAFLKARMDGCPIEDCLRYAAATGASCVEAYDALSGLRSFAELDRKIQAGWEKQNFSPLT